MKSTTNFVNLIRRLFINKRNLFLNHKIHSILIWAKLSIALQFGAEKVNNVILLTKHTSELFAYFALGVIQTALIHQARISFPGRKKLLSGKMDFHLI